MSADRTGQITGLQRRSPASMPMPATGSKSQKFSTSLRACTSIQRIDGSTAMRSMTARTFRRAVQADPRHQRARRQQHDARAVAAELGIELERARHHRRRGHAAAAVADHDDLVGLGGARDLDQAARAGLDRRSKHDGSPRAYSNRYGQWLLICTTNS